MELLVVFGVMALLVAIALPAVSSMRSRARALSCGNNLRNLGLALQNYHAAHRVFPANFLGMVDRRFVNDHSVLTRLLPYLDGNSDAVEFSRRDFAFARGKETIGAWLPLFVCPDEFEAGFGFYGSNYFCNSGTHVGVFPPTARAGAFEAGKMVSAAKFRDGLSATAMMSERCAGREEIDDLWTNTVNVQSGVFSDLDGSPDAWSHECSQISRLDLGMDSTLGRLWNEGGTLFYNHVNVPNARSIDCGYGSGYIPRIAVITARSYHRDAVNMLFADGAVKLLSSNVDLRVWRDQGTRAGE